MMSAGKPCVLIDGFRAISVSGARRSGVLGAKPECSLPSQRGSERLPDRAPLLNRRYHWITCDTRPKMHSTR